MDSLTGDDRDMSLDARAARRQAFYGRQELWRQLHLKAKAEADAKGEVLGGDSHWALADAHLEEDPRLKAWVETHVQAGTCAQAAADLRAGLAPWAGD